MEKIERHPYFDKVINVALINLYTLSKEKQKIVLKNFNYKNESHRAIFEIAKIARDVFGFDIEFKGSIWHYLLTKIALKTKIISRTKEKNGIDVSNFIHHIEEANEDPTLFKEIYDFYYKKYYR